MTETFIVKTGARSALVDITDRVAALVTGSGIQEGVCLVYSPHTTCGITINEHADPDVKADIVRSLDRLVPWESGYRHAEGNSAAHIKATLTGSSAHLPVSGGRPLLGIWQGIFLCEFDGPRTRSVIVHIG